MSLLQIILFFLHVLCTCIMCVMSAMPMVSIKDGFQSGYFTLVMYVLRIRYILWIWILYVVWLSIYWLLLNLLLKTVYWNRFHAFIQNWNKIIQDNSKSVSKQVPMSLCVDKWGFRWKTFFFLISPRKHVMGSDENHLMVMVVMI